MLRVISSMDPKTGGPCQGIRNALPELLKLGVHTHVVCLDKPNEPFITKEIFPITGLGPSVTSWCYNKRLIPWLLEHLGQYDTVIVHGLWQYHGYAVLKALNTLKKRKNGVRLPLFYVMPHGMLDPYFQKAAERKLKALRNKIYWKLIESKVINSADGLLFTCKEELILARGSFRPYHPKKEINIGYGIESPPPFETSFRSSFLEKCPQLKDKKYILFLSRIHEKKGVNHLIEAYSAILNKRKLKDIGTFASPLPKLVIAGPGIDTPFGIKMLQMVNSSEELRQSVFFPGMIQGDAKWGAFYGSEVFILPSHQENFGIAVAEALACGKPVLISRFVNIWREIIEGGAGLVEDDSTNGTMRLLESWYEMSTTQKETMNENALSVFMNNFSIAPAAKNFKMLLGNHI